MSTTKWLRLAYYNAFQAKMALERELEKGVNARVNGLRLQCGDIEASLSVLLTDVEMEKAMTEGESATD